MRCHLQAMPLGRRSADDYPEAERVRAAAEPLTDARILHLAAAGSRARSAELLPSLLSTYKELGIHADLKVLLGDSMTRELEDGLSGGETAITDDIWDKFLENSPAPTGYDAVIAHGPGPLAAASKSGAPCVWRCELDCSSADAATLERLRPLADAIAVPHADYAPPGIAVRELPEAIDPLAPGSIELPVRLAGSLLRSLGLDLGRPICFHQFDAWQDPHAVIDAVALPGLQLVLVGDEWRLLPEVSAYAESNDDILVFHRMGDVELNALRALARAGIESALARGSELAALETWWKGTPVIDASAERVTELVSDPGLAIELGAQGHERVREHHLITHLAESELRLLASFQSP